MDRRSFQCHRDGCDSQATNAVVLHLRCMSPGGVGRDLKFNCTIKVCDAHRDMVRGYVLSDVNREIMTTKLMDMNYPEPDFLNARIEFVPIVLPEAPPALVLSQRCDREGCANPAKWRIKQLFRALAQNGRGKPAASALTNLCVCDKHKRATKAADVMASEEDREATRKFLVDQGLLLPDLDHVMIEFVAIDQTTG